MTDPATIPRFSIASYSPPPASGLDVTDRIPPQAIEAEESVLGSIIFQPDSIDQVLEVLTPEMFYISAHQKIYAELLRMSNGREAIDLLTLSAKLELKGELDAVGGRSKLTTLVDRCMSAVNIDAHANLIYEAYWLRQIIKTGQDITKLGFSSEPLSEVMNLVDSRSYDLVSRRVTGLSDDESIADLAIRWFEDLESVMNGTPRPTIQTGFYDLDAMTNGLRPGRLTILMARPGQGKTALALNIIKNVASSTLRTAAFFSLEMPKEDIFTRMIAMSSMVDSKKLETGQLSESELEKSATALELLASIPLYLNDTASTVEAIRVKCRKLARSNQGLSLIVIDHLQYLLKFSTDPVRDAGKITKGLVSIAKELEVPVILLQQLNRNVESRQNKRPIMADGRQSGEVEEDAHNIWALYRDEYYDPNTVDRGVAELINLKNRSGETGTVKLLFEPRYSLFRNLARRDGYNSVTPVQREPETTAVQAEPVAVQAAVEIEQPIAPPSYEEIIGALSDDDEEEEEF
jgi:replicative DNA helicase